MEQNTYPKTFTHRNDHHSVVVVANAEQEAQLPDDYRPAVTGASGQTVDAADHATDVMLTPEYAQLMADREALEQARAEFAEHEARTRKELEDGAQALADDRAKLTAGYRESVAQLEADRAAWEASKHDQAPEGTGDTASAAPATPAAAADAPAATAPAKRVRTAKE